MERRYNHGATGHMESGCCLCGRSKKFWIIFAISVAILILVLILVIVFVALKKTNKEYEQVGLKLHNEHRRHHGGANWQMRLDEDLNSRATSCAKHNAKRQKLGHDCPQQKGFGENLWVSTGNFNETTAVTSAIKSWYAELKKYDFNKPGYSKGTGHLTQMIWLKSVKLGVGVAYSDRKLTFVACLYAPQGNINYTLTFRANVLPPGAPPVPNPLP